MIFKISKPIFSNALQTVSRAVSSNSPLPALAGIKITVKESSLTLIGSDSDISVKVELSNEINSNTNLVIESIGEMVIDSRFINEIVKKIDSNEIKFELIDGTLIKISGINTEYNINGIRPVDYPNIDFSLLEDTFVINSKLLAEVINQTYFATSDTETRPVLTGVNFNCNGNTLKCVATDSYRLSQKEVSLENDYEFNITIPKKSLIEIQRSLINNEEIKVNISENKAQFLINNVIIQTRLIDGDYPNVDRLIPTDFEYELKIQSKDLLTAIDRTSFIKLDGINIIKLSCNRKNISVKSESNEVGSAYQDLQVISYEGEDLKISFSGQYVHDALKAINSNVVKISFSGEMKPFIITSEDNENNTQLVLPIRTYN
jgi:DNA polymerase-3 subunit beta